MSHFNCPHCGHEIDIFSKGGVEKTAKQFGLTFLGSVELDPEIRKGGDTGRPVTLEGEGSARAKSLFQFARNVKSALDELNARPSESVIEIR